MRPRDPPIAAEARTRRGPGRRPRDAPGRNARFDRAGTEWLRAARSPAQRRSDAGRHPGITPELWPSCWSTPPDMPDRIVAPRCDGRRGHPIVLPWSIAGEVHALPAGMGINALVARHRDRLVELAGRRTRGRRRPRYAGGPAIAGKTTAIERDPLTDDLPCGCGFASLPWPRSGPGVGNRARAARRLEGRRSSSRARRAFPGTRRLCLPTALIAIDEEYAGDDALIRRLAARGDPPGQRRSRGLLT